MKPEKKTKDQIIAELKQQIHELKDLSIENKKKNERLLLLDKAFKTTVTGISIKNLNNIILYVNPADAKMHGYTVEELIGKDARNYGPSGTKSKRLIPLEDMKEMKSWARESMNIRKDGSYFPVYLISDAVRDDEGHPIGIVTTCEDITNRKKIMDELQTLSLTDDLTGLRNRRGFFYLFEHGLKLADREKKGQFLLYADLDNLKKINDTYGHKEGDLALIEAARILEDTCRKSDIIARIGGDEFVVYPIRVEGHSELIIDRLKQSLDMYNSKSSKKYKLSISIGLGYYDPKNPCSVDELLAQADKSLYNDKKNKERK